VHTQLEKSNGVYTWGSGDEIRECSLNHEHSKFNLSILCLIPTTSTKFK